MHKMGYGKFAMMMLIGLIIMYLVMFLNITELNHYQTSVTRVYMAILMVAPMAFYMIAMMGKMYPSKNINLGIMVGSVVVFAITLWALRAQKPIGDVQYMKAMIPHHSSAILTSKKASISDPEVKKLSLEIIAAQEREIAEMKALIKKLTQ
ncbi:MAG: DUF305 domain-containing protein [Chitinophagaceae bacterium]|nr:DUF305 domain-containing protein [Chitinophagaceae bacterium]